MKKTSCAVLFAALAFCFYACQAEISPADTSDSNSAGLITCRMSATMPEFKAGGDPETKSSLESVVRVKWKKDDELSVINLTTGKQLGGCIKADNDGANSTFSPSGLVGSITAGDKLVFLLDNDPSHRSASEKTFEPFTMDFSSQKGNANEVPIVVYADYTATANGTIDAVNPVFNFLMGYVQLAVSALPASTSVTQMGIENLNTKCHFSISGNNFVTTPQNGNITLSEAFTANSKGTNTRYFSCFTSPSQIVARNAHINANSQSHVTAWLKAALSAGYYYQAVATGFTNENISFVDDTFKSYCVSNYDKNGDGEVSFAEAAAVTSFASFSASEKSSLKEVYELPYFFKGERIPDFGGCTALKQVLLPGTLQTIQANAFKGCTALEEITVPSNVTTVGEGAFEGCTSLERFNGALASADRRYLVKDNHVLAFAPAGLTETTIPDGVTTINAGVFANNTTIKTVNLSAELTTVEARAFKGCSALPIIRFRTNIASIGEDAFKGCSSLRSVYSDAVTPPSVGTDAFANCHASLVAHVTSGNLAAYSANSAWNALSVTSAQPWNEIWYTTTDGNDCNPIILSQYSNQYVSTTFVDGKGIILFNQDLTGALPVQFYNKSTLASVQLPYGITSIGGSAFVGCSSLSSIILPESVVSIGTSAFLNCTALSSVVLPETLTSIGATAFYDCESLVAITLPDSMESIGSGAFMYCASLNAVYADPSVLAGINYSDASNPLKIAHNLYSKGNNPELITSIVIPNTVSEIKQYAFCGCTSIETVSISSGVTSIGRDAFNGCTNLRSIVIPPTIQTIERDAFYDCGNMSDVYITDLTAWCNIDFAYDSSSPLNYGARLFLNSNEVSSLTIPQSFTEVKQYSFYGCTSLEAVSIPSGVTSIGSSAFSGCSSLESISIPSGVASIGQYAFYGCSNLTSITIPDSVESIGSGVFASSGLTSLVLPNGVTSIPLGMCGHCSNLENVTLPDNVSSIGQGAFSATKLSTITIPARVTSWYDTFQDCLYLQTVYIKTLTPPSGRLSFGWALNTIYVPTASVDAYKSAWPDYASKIIGYDFE